MNTCKTCKWWHKQSEDACVGVCEAETEFEYMTEGLKYGMTIVEDGTLMTGSLFGCVLWEENYD